MSNLSITSISGYSLPNIIISHQIYLFAIWGLFIDLPILIIRYGKLVIPPYLNLHSIMGLANSAITAYYIVIMLIISLFYHYIDNASWTRILNNIYLLIHFICALTLLGVCTLMIITGIIIREFMFSDKYKAGFLMIKLIHKILGYLVAIVGKVAVIMGLFQYNNQILYLYKIILVLMYHWLFSVVFMSC